MLVFVTKRAHGRYMLTATRPTVCDVKGAGIRDAYARPGDPLVVQDLCEWGVRQLWPGLDIQPLESERRELNGV